MQGQGHELLNITFNTIQVNLRLDHFSFLASAHCLLTISVCCLPHTLSFVVTVPTIVLP
jgi:hypothetical protein